MSVGRWADNEVGWCLTPQHFSLDQLEGIGSTADVILQPPLSLV